MASERCTLEGGHDSLYEYQCSLCEEEGQHVEATKFCKECFVYMCDSCVQTKHNMFPLNKRHQMLEHAQFSTVKASSLRSFPTKRCPKHPGELINIYCGEHDVVCCLVCKTLEHNNCAKSQHLVDAAKGIHIKSKECQNIIKETEAFLSNVEKIINDGKTDIIRISEAKEEVKTKIAEFRKRVDMYFDDLEAKSLDELQNLESKIISDVEQGVKSLDASRTEVDGILRQLQSFKGDNECELFVHVKESNRLLSETKKSMLNISGSVRKESIYYQVDPEIEEFLKSLNTLGSFTDKPVTIIRHFEKDVEASDTRTDTVEPLQFEMSYSQSLGFKLCVLPSGVTLIADTSTLRAFDSTNQPIDTKEIPKNITSLCSVGNNEAAVLYYNGYVSTVGFVTGRKVLKMHRIFSIETNGYEMVCSGGLLYICCEKRKECRSDTDGKMCNKFVGYHIALYNQAGQCQSFIPQLPLCFAAIPECMTVSDYSQLLLVYYHKTNILLFSDISGKEVASFDIPHLRPNQKICTDGRGHIFALTANNEVIRLFLQHQKMEVILTKEDGINNSKEICFDRNKSTLLVLCEEKRKDDGMKNTNAYIFTYTVHTFNLVS